MPGTPPAPRFPGSLPAVELRGFAVGRGLIGPGDPMSDWAWLLLVLDAPLDCPEAARAAARVGHASTCFGQAGLDRYVLGLHPGTRPAHPPSSPACRSLPSVWDPRVHNATNLRYS